MIKITDLRRRAKHAGPAPTDCFIENCSLCPPTPEHAREARILGWERFIRAKQSTLIGRSWDVTHPDDLRDYACHVVNEEEALAAFLAKERHADAE